MADCNDLFTKFQEQISLNESKKDYLKQARDGIRNRIKNYFINEKKYSPPKFWIQGSYKMSTIINPLDEEYDIDDGIYLQNIDSENIGNWPNPETVHSWIYQAVKGHTQENPIDKRTCVRVVYSGKYHVDLPIYGIFKDEIYLAEKGEKGWHLSNPITLLDWFNEQVKQNSDQLKKIVRYFKAWADFQTKSKNKKLPSRLILTILATENYENREKDDATFSRTVRNIYQKIFTSFVIYNPVGKEEILSNHLTDTQSLLYLLQENI
jgi:hypothetical protein